MRVAIVGLGSIGTRRARLLAGFEDVDEMVVCDNDVQRIKDFVLNLDVPMRTRYQAIVPTFSIAEALEYKPDAVLICTPAETHMGIALSCVGQTKGIFIEKPLAPSMDFVGTLLERAEHEGTTVMVACNMRWAYAGLASQCEELKPTWLRFESHRPLSQWRDGAEAYRKHGIVLESAIHEIDLAYSVWGAIKDISLVKHISGDVVEIAVEHRNDKLSVISANWRETARCSRRVFLMDCGTHSATMEANTSDAMYQHEMRHFLDCVTHNVKPWNSLADAAHVLSWALTAKEMAV